MKVQAPPQRPADRHSERGSGLMLAVLVTATMFALIATSFVFLQEAKVSINRQLSFDGQTMNAAQAGLIDTLSWFRRQQTQPVTQFSPALNANGSPPVNETDEPVPDDGERVYAERPNKTAEKRETRHLRDLVVRLAGMPPERLDPLPLSERMRDAIAEYQRIRPKAHGWYY